MALTYRTFTGSATAGPTVTYSGLAIGTASSDRWVLVGVFRSRNASTSETVTFSVGTAAQIGTTVVEGGRVIDFWAGNVTTGTTVDVTITGNGAGSSFFECAVAVWTEDAGEPTLFDQDSATKDAFDGSMTVSIDVDTSGILLAMATHGFEGGGATYTGITEDFDVTSPTNLSGASDDGLTSETGRSVAAQVDGGTFENVMKVISLSPPAAGGITGDVDVVYPAFTTSAVGEREVTGDATSTFPSFTASGVGDIPRIEGAAFAIFGSFTAAALGTKGNISSIAATLPSFGVSATGNRGVSGDVAVTFGSLQAAGVGGIEEPLSGTIAVDFPTFIATSSGTLTLQGSAAVDFPSFTASALGGSGKFGIVSVTLPSFSASATGRRGVSGGGEADFPALIASSSGAKGSSGTIDITLTSFNVSATGNRGVSGSGDAVFPMLEVELTQAPIGDVNATFPSFGVNAVGYSGGKNTIQLVG